MAVPYCKDLTEFESYMEKSKEKLVVVDFTATWCGPCKMISPFFQQLADDNPDVIFIKVDVDDAADIAEKCLIQSMPTFKFFKNLVQVKTFSGASKDMLRDSVAALK